jgi:hypothetical protein
MVVCVFVCAVVLLWAQVPYAPLPQWESEAEGCYGTGFALVDIDGDGMPDAIVACGNDMARQPVRLFLNRGGQLERVPSWRSADSGYHGHIAVADVDGDGWQDVVVTEYLGAGGFGTRGGVKLYRNRHGNLEPLPAWRARESFSSFRCAWGDVDGDGRPDLAVAGGEVYRRLPEPVRLYRNRDGWLESEASWQSADSGYAYDVLWEDINGDGWLDLVVACAAAPSRVYLNRGGQLERIPSWVAQEVEFANSLSAADVDGDGWIDVVISYNRQLGGSGRVVLFRNRAGQLEPTPSWRSAFAGYGSGVVLVDLTGDGLPELVSGAWWDTVRVYLNRAGAFGAEADWRSQTRSVVEAFAFADVNADGLDTVVWHLGRSRPGAPLFRLPVRPVERVLEVRRGQTLVPPTQYVVERFCGWLSAPLFLGESLSVRAVLSHRLDMGVSNWDPTEGEYLFLWGAGSSGVGYPEVGRLALVVRAAERVEAECTVPEAGWVRLEWVDVLGRRWEAFSGWLPAGRSQVVLRQPPAVGLYWLCLHSSAGSVVCACLLRL